MKEVKLDAELPLFAMYTLKVSVWFDHQDNFWHARVNEDVDTECVSRTAKGAERYTLEEFIKGYLT